MPILVEEGTLQRTNGCLSSGKKRKRFIWIVTRRRGPPSCSLLTSMFGLFGNRTETGTCNGGWPLDFVSGCTEPNVAEYLAQIYIKLSLYVIFLSLRNLVKRRDIQPADKVSKMPE